MIKAILKRHPSTDSGTFGSIQAEGFEPFCSLELPWRDNHVDFSCIPTGEYLCTWQRSLRLNSFCYHLENVPNRSGILIHAGNWAGDVTLGKKSNVEGCIVLGTRFGVMDGQRGVMNSRAALALFAEELQYKEFTLSISWANYQNPLGEK